MLYPLSPKPSINLPAGALSGFLNTLPHDGWDKSCDCIRLLVLSVTKDINSSLEDFLIAILQDNIIKQRIIFFFFLKKMKMENL